MISTFNQVATTTTLSTASIITIASAGVIVLLGLIVSTGICLAVYKKKKQDTSHIYETPGRGSTNPHFAMSMSMSKAPDVMAQNSAYMDRVLLLMMATRNMKTLLQISGP